MYFKSVVFGVIGIAGSCILALQVAENKKLKEVNKQLLDLNQSLRIECTDQVKRVEERNAVIREKNEKIKNLSQRIKNQ